MIIESFGPQTVVAGAGAGLAATLVMDLIMSRLPEGETTPLVAAGVLTETPPDEAPARLASTVHYVAGTGAGILFVTIAGILATLLTATTIEVGLESARLALLVTATAYPALMIGFFILVPLPRVKGLSRQRSRQVARDWAVCAISYVLVVTAVVSGLSLAG